RRCELTSGNSYHCPGARGNSWKVSPPTQRGVLFIFPGQGSQYRGMGRDLVSEFPAARKIYDLAGEVLGYDLADLSFRDPRNRLNLTRFTQPALLTHSIACLKIFEELTEGKVAPVTTAGHSLGE